MEVLPQVHLRQSWELRFPAREQIRWCAGQTEKTLAPVPVGYSIPTVPGVGQTPGPTACASTSDLRLALHLHRPAPSQTSHDADTSQGCPKP